MRRLLAAGLTLGASLGVGAGFALAVLDRRSAGLYEIGGVSLGPAVALTRC